MPQKKWSPPACWILFHKIFPLPAQVTEILRHEHFLAQLHRARFEKLLQRCPYLCSNWAPNRGDFFSGPNRRVFWLKHDSVWNSMCFHLDVMKTHPCFFKKLTATKQVSATEMLEIGAQRQQEMTVWQRIFPFHLFFVNVPRLKKVGEHVVKPGWLEIWFLWEAT